MPGRKPRCTAITKPYTPFRARSAMEYLGIQNVNIILRTQLNIQCKNYVIHVPNKGKEGGEIKNNSLFNKVNVCQQKRVYCNNVTTTNNER